MNSYPNRIVLKHQIGLGDYVLAEDGDNSAQAYIRIDVAQDRIDGILRTFQKIQRKEFCFNTDEIWSGEDLLDYGGLEPLK